MTTDYDYIICGAGCAGLSLAIRLADPEFSHRKVLILDKAPKNTNDRTWSFWAKSSEDRYTSIYARSWTQLVFHAPEFSVRERPFPYEYHTIHGIDFYNYCLEIIDKCPHIEFKVTAVEQVVDEGDFVTVRTEDASYRCTYVFDSIVRKYPKEENLFVWQHFLGWEVEFKDEVFDESTATFMDFRIHQEDETIFVYVLPYDKKKALIEVTFFSKEILEENEYEALLKPYVSKYYGDGYRTLRKELGAIPMTTASFGKGTPRVIPLGTNNGTVKPSTGYAFNRIQREVDILTDRIRKGRIKRVKPKRRFIAYDRTLLNVLISGKEEGRVVFSRLFKKNKVTSILKFLNEETNLLEETRIFSTLPFWSFLRAFARENVFQYTKTRTISLS